VVLFGGFFLAPLVLIVLYSFWEVVNYNVASARLMAGAVSASVGETSAAGAN
jgi:hypothetical protein